MRRDKQLWFAQAKPNDKTTPNELLRGRLHRFDSAT
jgi:hypothetical protein